MANTMCICDLGCRLEHPKSQIHIVFAIVFVHFLSQLPWIASFLGETRGGGYHVFPRNTWWWLPRVLPKQPFGPVKHDFAECFSFLGK